jgi:glycosyltransferase involved in cell wall biosynthesis
MFTYLKNLFFKFFQSEPFPEKKDYLEQKDQLTISVIFLSYQHKDYVVEAIRSLLYQDYQEAYEIIIGDDGSTDGTRELILDELKCYKGPARIVMLEKADNMGLKRNFNRCVSKVTGNIFVCASGDDISYPHRLSHTINFYKTHPNCYATYANARIINENNKVTRNQYYSYKGNRRFFLFKKNEIYQGLPFCGATSTYKIDVIHKFGPLLEDVGSEDNACSFRALMLGDVWMIDELTVDWRWHGKNMSFGSKQLHTTIEEKINYLAKRAIDATYNCNNHLADIKTAEINQIISKSTAEYLLQLVNYFYYSHFLKSYSINGSWSNIIKYLNLVWTNSNSFRCIPFLLKCLTKKLLPRSLRAKILFKNC